MQWITGTPDLSGSNTHRLDICRMNPAFRTDAMSCTGGIVQVAGRFYFNFGKNSAAVLHVAALNASSEQPFTWATVSDISFT
jgi:hypothetical protein